MRKILFAFACLLCISIAQAQTSSKKHFIIHRIDNTTDITKYQEAASAWGQLDAFRFMDKRRTINFTDGKASIELYSAKELLEMYGKHISDLTITSDKYPNVAFDVTMDGKGLKPQLIK
jgi:hypothetical protein